MDLQDRYDELDNIESKLRNLIDETSDISYIEPLRELMYQAQNEKSEVGERLQKQYEREEAEQERMYWREAI